MRETKTAKRMKFSDVLQCAYESRDPENNNSECPSSDFDSETDDDEFANENEESDEELLTQMPTTTKPVSAVTLHVDKECKQT
ncbi:hypothetical protein SNE40_010690 [Patella caerulea]|uniref:Uncharacterized protein n=1 Tax=Patella caerulea TaxID=87958 RepID=A0AAN8JUZ0_PATCE